MDLVEGKLLQELLDDSNFQSNFTEEQTAFILREILDALAYMASVKVMHRDIKPLNIIMEKGGRVRIVDFGLATEINLTNYIYNRCGSSGFIAPEIFLYNPKNSSTAYNDRCDVFSAGCIFFHM